ncbi:MAG TPA: hypothetical protein DCS43_10835 [Verrucomicrobia bacterium]|nr:hypothetical protein [Verrucomicrobiota bacterium]
MPVCKGSSALKCSVWALGKARPFSESPAPLKLEPRMVRSLCAVVPPWLRRSTPGRAAMDETAVASCPVRGGGTSACPFTVICACSTTSPSG